MKEAVAAFDILPSTFVIPSSFGFRASSFPPPALANEPGHPYNT